MPIKYILKCKATNIFVQLACRFCNLKFTQFVKYHNNHISAISVKLLLKMMRWNHQYNVLCKISIVEVVLITLPSLLEIKFNTRCHVSSTVHFHVNAPSIVISRSSY